MQKEACDNYWRVIQLIDEIGLSKECSDSQKYHYSKMKADYYRYLVENCTGQDCDSQTLENAKLGAQAAFKECELYMKEQPLSI